jgi:hypothetical protein
MTTEPALLLDDRYQPITSTIGFLELDLERAAEGYRVWQERVHHRRGRPYKVTTRRVAGALTEVLDALPPLDTPTICRRALVPTVGPWTAYFDNYFSGTDAAGPMSYLAVTLNCRSMRITAQPNTMQRRSQRESGRGRYGASIFELYGPVAVNHNNSVRSIAAMNDGGRWVFETFGPLLPFEVPTAYDAPRPRDKFPFSLLDRYARALGVRPFDESFYCPGEGPPAVLFELVGEHPPNFRTFSLGDVQAGVPWRR